MNQNGKVVLIIDHFSSFTHLLAHLFLSEGAQVKVVRTDVSFDDIKQYRPTHIVLSPGPGHPCDAQMFFQAVAHWGGSIPILGVCLGMQAIAIVGGLTVSRNVRMMHGKTSPIQHSGVGLFADVDPSIAVMRYHSLIPQWPTAQCAAFECVEYGHQVGGLQVTAFSMHKDDVEIMAIQLVHQGAPVVGVQFHPESYYPVMNSVPFYDSYGKRMVQNFLAML